VYEEGDNEDEVEDEDDLYFEESDEEVRCVSVGTSWCAFVRLSVLRGTELPPR
jgi:hypothetical protein